jgi:CheY-like chemotaxis protein
MKTRPLCVFEILLVEDNPGDVRLTREALKDGAAINLHVVRDGEKAVAFLRQEGEYTQAPRPDLILLDLNLPRKNGREVLAEIKITPSLKRIPVVVITASEAEQDILNCYDLHANCFITKPMDLDRFMSILKAVKQFWLTVAKLPPGGE